MATMSEKPSNVIGPTLSRRQFIKAGGVLAVGFSFVGTELLKADTAKVLRSRTRLIQRWEVRGSRFIPITPC